MSGLLNKVKDAVKNDSGSGNQNNGQESGIERTADNFANKEIDQATDRAGLGDKYDQQIDQFADKELNNEIPGGAGNPK